MTGQAQRPYLLTTLYGIRVNWLADTGAGISVIDASLLPQGARARLKPIPLPPGFKVMGATGHEMSVIGKFPLEFRTREHCFTHPVVVVKGLASKAILGMDFLNKFNASIDTRTREVHIRPAHMQVMTLHVEEVLTLTAAKVIRVRAGRKTAVNATATGAAAPGTTVLCKGERIEEAVTRITPQGKVPVIIANNSLEDWEIARGTILGHGEAVDAIKKITQPLQQQRKTLSPEKWDFLKKTIRQGFKPPWDRHFWQLIREYHDVFSDSSFDLGRADAVTHKVRLKTEQPVHVKQFKIPWAHMNLVNEHADELLKKGCIEPSRSPYNSPVFCVPKKSGELRVVQDLRALNAASYEDKYCIREISECIDEIGKARSTIFSSLDLTSGFWQMVLEPASRESTAFTIPGRGRFQWTRTPMGLHGSPASFARLMDFGMAGAKGIITYIDDVLSHSADMPGHLQSLKEAFTRLRKFNLKLNPAKCEFGAEKVPYLGFMLTKDGVKPGEDKIKAVREFPPPRTPKAIREFTGLVNYFRHMVPGYSYLSGYLSHLLTKKAGWEGGQLPEKAMWAFNKLKESLCSEPLLAYPRNDREFTLAVDAATGDTTNPGGLGAVLTQKNDKGQECVVSYASRSLRDHEKNYSVFLLEQLAATWAIDTFYVYLRGNRFTLLTDHRPMEKLSTLHTKTLNRLKQQMSEFNFNIRYREGKLNTAADALSRNPVDQGQVKDLGSTHPVEEIKTLGLNSDHIRRLQKEDPFCSMLVKYMKEGALPESTQDLTMIKLYLPKVHIAPDGICYYIMRQGEEHRQCLIVPATLQPEILKAGHCHMFSGHGGRDKTLWRIQRGYWWPRVATDVASFVDMCRACKLTKNPQNFKQKHAPLQPIPVPHGPNRVVHFDLFGPLKTTSEGKKYILVGTDAFTKWAEVIALNNKDAETVGKAIFDHWICRFGCPHQIITDRGTDFCSLLGEKLYGWLGIKHSKTAAFHPQCNSAAESFNRTIIKYMKVMLLDEDTLDWELYLPTLRICYNTAVHRTIGNSPFFLTFAHEPNLPFFDLERPQTFYTDDWATHAFITLKKSYQMARGNALKTEGRNVKNKARHEVVHSFKEGQRVLLYFPSSTRQGNKKFLHDWMDGYVVHRQIGNNTFILRSEDAARRRTIAHADRMQIDPTDWKVGQNGRLPSLPTLQQLRDGSARPLKWASPYSTRPGENSQPTDAEKPPTGVSSSTAPPQPAPAGPPPKRGRGRPRKLPLTEEQQGQLLTTLRQMAGQSQPREKRRRGRPRKDESTPTSANSSRPAEQIQRPLTRSRARLLEQKQVEELIVHVDSHMSTSSTKKRKFAKCKQDITRGLPIKPAPLRHRLVQDQQHDFEPPYVVFQPPYVNHRLGPGRMGRGGGRGEHHARGRAHSSPQDQRPGGGHPGPPPELGGGALLPHGIGLGGGEARGEPSKHPGDSDDDMGFGLFTDDQVPEPLDGGHGQHHQSPAEHHRGGGEDPLAGMEASANQHPTGVIRLGGLRETIPLEGGDGEKRADVTVSVPLAARVRQAANRWTKTLHELQQQHPPGEGVPPVQESVLAVREPPPPEVALSPEYPHVLQLRPATTLQEGGALPVGQVQDLLDLRERQSQGGAVSRQGIQVLEMQLPPPGRSLHIEDNRDGQDASHAEDKVSNSSTMAAVFHTDSTGSGPLEGFATPMSRSPCTSPSPGTGSSSPDSIINQEGVTEISQQPPLPTPVLPEAGQPPPLQAEGEAGPSSSRPMEAGLVQIPNKKDATKTKKGKSIIFGRGNGQDDIAGPSGTTQGHRSAMSGLQHRLDQVRQMQEAAAAAIAATPLFPVPGPRPHTRSRGAVPDLPKIAEPPRRNKKS